MLRLRRRLEREPGLSVTPNPASRSLKRLFRPRLPLLLFGLLLGQVLRPLVLLCLRCSLLCLLRVDFDPD